MDALLEERSRRQQSTTASQEDREGNLKSLVESVKRKAKAREGDGKAGKRRRLDR